jgi:tRNA modification GTPase
MFKNDTIIALATPPYPSAVSVIRISGKKSKEITKKIFLPKVKKKEFLKPWTLHYGKIINPSNKKIIDEVIVAYFPEKKSYTSEEMIEVYCHGGGVVANLIISLYTSYGARLAKKGEFTLRGFLQGRIDLSQAEAINEIVNSKTKLQLELAQKNLRGAFSEKIKKFKKELLNLTALLEVEIDYPDENIPLPSKSFLTKKIKDLVKKIDDLLNNSLQSKYLKEGIKVCILGKVNVGKSSIFNALLEEDKALVYKTPGTTRDVNEGYLELHSVLVCLQDTAGIRKTKKGKIEILGIKKTKKVKEKADLIILVLDCTKKITELEKQLLKEKNKKIVVLNKIDLKRKILKKDLKKICKNFEVLECSAKTNEGIKNLRNKIAKIVSFELKGLQEEKFYLNQRQESLLQGAKNSLLLSLKNLKNSVSYDILCFDLKECLSNLQEIIGEKIDDEILEHIFSNFCIGK